MNAAFITTVNHNVGDDFVREGILFFLEKCFVKISSEFIHKHAPITVRKNFEWVRSYPISLLLDLFPIVPGKDKILTADILIQSGAPVFWCHPGGHCARNEWYGPLIKRRYVRVRDKVPFLNLAAGTCQKYFSDGSEFFTCRKCSGYIKELYGLSSITTVRDKLAQKVLRSFGLDVTLLPCPSIYARDRLKIAAEEPRYICLNYMRGGGHYNFSQNIDCTCWEQTFKAFYHRIKDKYDCVFVCHNMKELRDARRIAPNAKKFFSTDYIDYIKFYAHSLCGVVNRIHSAFAIASFGRPSLVIGSDTRATMAEEIGLHHIFVSDATPARLQAEFEILCEQIKEYHRRIFNIKQTAERKYLLTITSGQRSMVGIS